jgi:hypothetical protein
MGLHLGGSASGVTSTSVPDVAGLGGGAAADGDGVSLVGGVAGAASFEGEDVFPAALAGVVGAAVGAVVGVAVGGAAGVCAPANDEKVKKANTGESMSARCRDCSKCGGFMACDSHTMHTRVNGRDLFGAVGHGLPSRIVVGGSSFIPFRRKISSSL